MLMPLVLLQNIFIHILDISRVKDVQDFVRSYVKEYGKLDVLVNNAGEMCTENIKTQSENLETNFATNVAGPYALTTGLIPLLQKSKKNPRVVRIFFVFSIVFMAQVGTSGFL